MVLNAEEEDADSTTPYQVMVAVLRIRTEGIKVIRGGIIVTTVTRIVTTITGNSNRDPRTGEIIVATSRELQIGGMIVATNQDLRIEEIIATTNNDLQTAASNVALKEDQFACSL